MEYEGTYPLPEAQLDRFLLKVVLPVPEREAELEILRRHADGLRPARRGRRPGSGRSPAPRTSRPAGPRVRRVQVSPEVAGYIVDIARATRESPSLSLGVSPRGATALMRAGPGVGLAHRPRLRHPRRREGAGPRDPRAPARAAARGRARGRRRGPGARQRPRLGARPALMTVHLRPGPAAAARWALVPGRAAPGLGTVWLWVLAVALLVLARLAAGARAVRVALEPARRSRPVRLGHADRDACCWSTNTARPAGARGAVRDAWQPTRRRRPATGTGSRLAPGDRVLLRTAAAARGAAATCAPSASPSAPAGRSGLAAAPAHARGAGHGARRCRRSTSRKHLPSRLARLRDLDGRAAVRVRGQGTEFDSLREYVRGDDVRSIDWRASARNRNVVVRTWQPERDRRVVLVLDTSRTSAGRVDDVPRLDSAMDAALLLAALAARAGDRVDFVAGDRRVRARLRAAGARDVAATLQDAMADLEPVIAEADWASLAGAVTGLGRQRALVVLLTPLEPSAVEEGLLPVLPTLTRHHRVVLASVRDPALDRLAAARGSARRGVRRRRGRAGARCAGGAPPTCSAPSAWTSSTPTPSGCRRRWPTTTSGSRRAGCSRAGLHGPGPSGLGGDPVLEQGGVEVAGVPAVRRRAGRARTRRRGSTASASTPIPSRAQVGSAGGGHEAPRSAPLTSSTATRPRATVPAVRPSWASDWLRVSCPGSTHDQNSRRPTPAGDEHRGQLEQAVRQDQPPEVPAAGRGGS